MGNPKHKSITKTEFAALAGITTPAVSKLIHKTGKLYGCVNDIGEISVLKTRVLEYLKGKDVSKGDAIRAIGSHTTASVCAPGTGASRYPQGGKPKDPDEGLDHGNVAIPEDILEFADRPYKEVVAMFATDARFGKWLDAVKKMEDIADKRLKNKMAQNEVIDRAFVEKYIFAYISSLQARLLQDSPRTLASRVSSLVNAGESKEVITSTIHNILSGYIKDAKQKVIGSLANATNRD